MRNTARILVLAAALLVAGCPPVRPPAAGLDRAVEAYFDEMLALNPTYATDIDDHRFDDRLEITPSPLYESQSLALERRYLDIVRAIDPETLDDEERLTREMFIYNREREIEQPRFPGPPAADRPVRRRPRDWNCRPTATAPARSPSRPSRTTTAGSRAPGSSRNGWMRRSPPCARAWRAASCTRASSWRRSCRSSRTCSRPIPSAASSTARSSACPRSFPAAERARLTQAFVLLIERDLNPSYRKLRDFIRDEYLPACRTTVGWSALPDGAAWYANEVRRHTTTRMTPDEIHEIGLAEVARIRAGMEEVMREVRFKGTLAEFFRYVQEEPAFYFTNPADLLAGYLRIKKQVDAELPRLFSIRPKADYEIRPVEAYRAAASAGGSYESGSPDGTRPGIFYVNTNDLKAQPIFGMETLSLHEASPGHHFQVSIAQELTGLPRFRRFEGNVAYEEGWALYSESLGRELGLFTDPMQWYGRLSDEMLRAMRLVVDTGLHAKGWTREQAMAYMHENSSIAESEIEAEVDRYIVYPGQALGYKVGDLRIQALRRRAAAALGDRFDLREFHTQVLEDGALPMDVLEAKIGRWIEKQQAPGGG